MRNSECPALRDIGNNSDTRGYLACDLEAGHRGIHRSDDYGIWWTEREPSEADGIPQAREIDPAVRRGIQRLRGGIEL